ncbi:MAG: STAS domain-containing protein [Burkholderiaceae bacterium]|jgi:phospholipid transport system transporter-binding protein|nr:STAS domain-containing protein [Burkholderiaceae bacterium]
MSWAVSALSLSNARVVLGLGLKVIEEGQREFDLGGMETTDSSSIAVLLAWQRAARAGGGAVRFLNVPSAVTSFSELYGVSDLLGLSGAP